jgi:hypothetical protein
VWRADLPKSAGQPSNTAFVGAAHLSKERPPVRERHIPGVCMPLHGVKSTGLKKFKTAMLALASAARKQRN